MKKYNLYLFAFMVTAALSSCSKSYLDVNTNPNSPTSTTPELVFPNALVVSASGQVTDFTYLEGWMGYWAPSGSYAVGNTDVASYYQTSGTYAGEWDKYYHNLQDYQYVENAAHAQDKPFYVGAAKVMKAYIFQQLVDMFNNVPYSQALQGTGEIQPAYDKGQDIYDSISAQLDSAVIYFQNPSATAKPTSDVLFSGDVSSWIAFANTLKLRILMRQSQTSSGQAVIAAGIAKIDANGGGYLTSDAGVNPGYASNAGQQSPVYGYFYTITGTPTSGGQADYWRASGYMIDYCRNYDDPRYKYFYQTVTGTDTAYVGNILGSTTNASGTASSGAAGTGIVKSVSQPAIVMTAAESYFLQAEAILRGYIAGGDPTSAYTSGVYASFNYLGASADSATKILSLPGNKNSNLAACTTTQEKLNCIIRQKWMAMNGTTPFEAWCDYRRLGLPANPSIPISVSPYKVSNNIPFRLLYPTTEYQTNAAAVAGEGTINPQTSKIWWMP
jgi:hypothetical protein